MKGLIRVIAAVCILGLMGFAGSGPRADPPQSPAGQAMMSPAPKAHASVPRCQPTPMIRAGMTLVALGTRLAQTDVGEWCNAEKYCRTGSFCCGDGCCSDGSNCCERDGGCCPASLPIGCGPKCYANGADAEADGCSNWEVCAAPVR